MTTYLFSNWFSGLFAFDWFDLKEVKGISRCHDILNVEYGSCFFWLHFFTFLPSKDQSSVKSWCYSRDIYKQCC